MKRARASAGRVDLRFDHPQALVTPHQRAVLQIALWRGRRSEAFRRYGTLRGQMLREFGEDLPFTLSELAAEEPGAIRFG